MKLVRWGMIGCGDVTEVKSGPAFQNIEGSELIAVMRRNKEKAKDYAKRHKIAKWYNDADELINDPDINAIYIATHPDSHSDYTIKAAKAGKNVYVEKPMARTYKECREMVKACDQASVSLFAAYYRRCLPNFLRVKELVDSGAIGEVRFVSIELYYPPKKEDLSRATKPWRVIPEISGGGYFFDLAPHQLDFLDYVFGPISSVKGLTANQAKLYPAEDIVFADFVFESGILGSGIWCFTVCDSSMKDCTQIIGSKGKISYSTFEPMPVRLETAKGVKEFDLGTPKHIQQPLIKTVVDELLERGKCPSTGTTAARTNKVMDEIFKDRYFETSSCSAA